MKKFYNFKSIIFIFFIYIGIMNVLHNYGNKYFSYDENQFSGHQAFGEITKNNPFSQDLIFNTKNLNEIGGINILTATYDRHNKSTLNVNLVDENHHSIAEQKFAADKIKDNSFISILFPNNYKLTSAQVHVTISSDANPGNGVTVYVGPQKQLEYNLIAKMHGYTKHFVFNILFVIYTAIVCMSYFIKNQKSALLIISLIFGCLFIIIGPIGSVPDEAAHYARAYTIANGVYINDVNDKTPTAALTAIANLPNKGLRAVFDDGYKSFFLKVLSPTDAIGTNSTYGSAVYSPVNYLPQLLGIKIAQVIHNNKFTTFYSARIIALICYFLTLYLCLRITPECFKWFLALTMLLPMALYQASSLSADGMNFILIFIFISLFAKLYFEKLQLNRKYLYFFIGLSFLIGLCKPTSIIILAILFALNSDLCGGYWQKIWKIGVIFLSCFITLYFWMKIINLNGINQSFIAHVHTFKHTFNNLGDAVQFSLHHPLHVANIMLFSIANFITQSYINIIGVLGWVNIELNRSTYHLIVLCFIMALSTNTSSKINKNTRLVALGIILLFIFATFFIFYATWTELSAHVIDGVQGRYFIPILPIFYFAFANKYLGKIKIEIEYFILMSITYALFNAVIALFNFYY